ncbi:ATP-binding cassette sub-family C member 10 [Cydia pomonella]|uniref:ATP-binding cassette sub-family C member 10 n=1 Tax=Cydia pomonella TaxID=82600 RepID=UPI002ADE4693|nr:ATP-binding cassette sub-family C member 10 [Cydia pomonella]
MFLDIPWRWEDMCGPAGLQPWNHASRDMGLCFQQLFLQIPLYFIIAVVSGYYIGYRRDWVIREKLQERAIVLRSFVVLTLVFIPIVELYIFITKVDFVLLPVDYFVAGASCLSWLVHFGYVLSLKHRLGSSSRGPSVQLFLWGLTVVLNVISLRSCVILGGPVAFYVATLCCHVVYFITLIPSSESRPTYYSACLVGSQHAHNEYTPLLPHMDEGVLGTAMQGNGCISQLLFLWVNPLLKKGFDKKLQDPEELFDIPSKYRCAYVGAKMDKALIGNVDNYQQYAEIPHEPFISSGYGALGESAPQSSTPVTPTSRVPLRQRRQNVTLLRALHSCFAYQFYSIGVLKLVSDMAGFAGPMLLNKLVAFVEDESIDQHYGYIYAAGLMASTLISTMFNVHFNWLMSLIGLKMRGAIVSTILRKTLSVTSTELNKSFSVGEITNFMSTDTDRIVNSCPSFHALWSIPLQLFITLFLLYQQVGISFLAGVAFSVLLIPINKFIANKIGQLSTELMKHKDSRVTLISDLLRGIRTVKVHVWEDYFINRVTESRTLELKYLRWRKYLDAICVVLWATTPVLVCALTLGVHALRAQPLLAPTVFTTVALINMLIAPLNAFPWVLNGLTEAWVSIKRIQKLLDLPDMDPERYYDKLNTNRNEDNMFMINNATFAWAKPAERRIPQPSRTSKGKSKKRLSKRNIQASDSSNEVVEHNEPFMLRDISLEIERGELIGVTGSVGSGKTSLLHAIMGDMLRKSGDIQIPESLNSFGYVSQKPWLIRGTIRDNILFGKPYDETKFQTVVEACALTEDLNVLGWGAHVGEGGCTLSGGQRARIALARAVYQDKQVYLLDDIFSGVDTRVAQHIMQRCVLGLLKRTTRILVSPSPRILARCSRTVLVHDGRIQALGPPEAVLSEIEEFLPSDSDVFEEEPPKAIAPAPDNQDNVSRNSLDEDEAMSEGTVGWWVLGLYLRSVGFFLSIAIILSLILMQLSQNFTFVWLTFWVRSKSRNITETAAHENTTTLDHGFNAIDTVIDTIMNMSQQFISHLDRNVTPTIRLDAPANVTPSSDDDFYLEVYFGLAGLNLLFTVMRAFLFAYGGVQAATRIHKILLRVVTKAKIKFFDVTPTGRILNRFSSDTYTVDDSLPFIMNIFLAQVFGLIGAVAVTVYGLPWLLAGVVPVAFIYYRLQRLYRVTSRQLKRLQSVTLSPVYAHFNDTLEGLSTIRALGAPPRWAERGEELVEAWQRAALCGAAAAQWLALRLQACAGACVAAAALLAAVQRATHALDPGLVGLAISYALSMTSMLSNVLNSFTETEREMIAVERVGEYITQVESEKIDGEPPPYGWPSQGVVSFEGVHLNYSRDGRGAALRGVTFSSYPGEKLGVVGRTGAGKSSLLQAILQLAPTAAGRVVVDGVPVHTLQLHALRSRIGMIPQEPFIFTGSVRENVDPLRQHSDTEIWRALERCGAGHAVRARGGLAARAAHASRGLAQLLCLARALLQRAKIVLIDEATANLDQETERLILDTIRSAFGGSTVLLIAHRVVGVLECSRVLVMADGRLLEFDSPTELLADPTSQLYALVHAHDH